MPVRWDIAVYDRHKQRFRKTQDAIVYASVKTHLEKVKPDKSCFLNRNVRDFVTPDIRNDLLKHNCKMISNFKDGLNFICSEL
ncbi:MAG: hypothetical protein AB7S75_09480 [Desulfococcaceae bacterium]